MMTIVILSLSLLLIFVYAQRQLIKDLEKDRLWWRKEYFKMSAESEKNFQWYILEKQRNQTKEK